MQSPNKANGRKVRSGYRTLIAGQQNREQSDEAKNQSKGGAPSGGGARRMPALVEFFWEHPAIVGSLLYLWVTTIGIIYSWALYRQYDINIFDFAETNDFLLAAFKDPFTFITAVVIIIGALLGIVISIPLSVRFSASL